MKPTFIGIGAQKCATTWLFRVLEDHPQAVLSQPKELHFFSSYYDHGYQWYERHFPDRAGVLAAGEYSTSYLYDLDAPARARRYDPQLRLIVMLRDPVARAYSNHLHEVRVGHLQGADLSFETAMLQNPLYVEQGLYAHHLQHWLQHFDRSRLLILLQEQVDKEPQAQAAAVYRFLGIDDTHVSPYLHERVNPSAADKATALRSVLRQGGNMLRRVGGEDLVRQLRVAPPIKALLASQRQELREVVPPMKPETEQRLSEAYGADMQALCDLLGTDELPWKSWRRLKAGGSAVAAAASPTPSPALP